MTIYEIDTAIRDIIENAVDPETGELDETVSAQLEALGMAREQKLENIACFIKDLEAESKAIRDEEKNLASRRRTADRKAESLRSYLEWALAGEKFKTPRCAVSFRKSTAVELEPDALAFLPERFLCFKEPEADKTAIKDAIKAGETVFGCKLVDKVSMIIK